LPRKADIVTINRDEAELTKNTDLFWKPKEAVHADPCHFLTELLEKVENKEEYSDWLQQCKEADASRDAEIEEMAAAPASSGLINPLNLFMELDKSLPDDAILVADGGDFVATASYILRPRSALSWLDPGPYGTLGVGGGFAIGAATIYPDRPVYIIYGDGSAGYSIVEIDTAKRHNYDNIKILIGNDGAWTQILRAQKDILGSPVANILSQSNYELIANAFDCQGQIIKNPENEKIRTSLEELSSASNPTILNALIGSTQFRDGSISV